MSEPSFSIARNGVDLEKLYWQAFASERFPSYEDFWRGHVAPLTKRGFDVRRPEFRIRFRTDAELAADDLGHKDVAIAQLHYTLLLHVGRVWQLLNQGLAFSISDAQRGQGFDRDHFFESFTRLSGASDVADELLERRRERENGTYPAWNEKAGRRAREAWRKREGDPLLDVRAYRNRLVHVASSLIGACASSRWEPAPSLARG